MRIDLLLQHIRHTLDPCVTQKSGESCQVVLEHPVCLCALEHTYNHTNYRCVTPSSLLTHLHLLEKGSCSSDIYLDSLSYAVQIIGSRCPPNLSRSKSMILGCDSWSSSPRTYFSFLFKEVMLFSLYFEMRPVVQL